LVAQSEGEAQRRKLKLEAPPLNQSGRDVDWSAIWLYRGAAIGQRKHRPVNTGDVFFDVTVFDLGQPVEKKVIVLQHPCAMRSDGAELLDRILVAEVAEHEDLCKEGHWRGNYNLMPLPRIHGSKPDKDKHYAVFFERLYVTTPDALDRKRRRGSMSLEGIQLLMQRRSHHNTRFVVPTRYFDEVVGPQYVETTCVEEWCQTRSIVGIPEPVATAEANKWLSTKDDYGVVRRKHLENPDLQHGVTVAMRESADQLNEHPPPKLTVVDGGADDDVAS